MTEPPARHERTRRITAEIPSDLYTAVVAAKIFSGRTINDLTCEGLELIARRYREERRAAREEPPPPSSESTS